MSLGVLIIFAACAIALIVFAVRVHTGSKAPPAKDPGEAIVEFGSAYPNEAIRDVMLTRDGQSAFFRLASGRAGMVHTVGRHYIARLIEPGTVTIGTPKDDSTLAVTFGETGYPGGDYAFSSPADAAEVSLWLCGSFVGAANAAAQADGNPGDA